MGRLPRDVFKPAVDEEGVFLYISNSIIEAEEPLNSLDQKQFVSILSSVLPLYSIECICCIVLEESFHLIIHVPKTPITAEDIADKLSGHPSEFLNRSRKSIDPGSLMKELQSMFTRWYNKTRLIRRNGSYWNPRYKCTRLTDESALHCCVEYLEFKRPLTKYPDCINRSRKKHISGNFIIKKRGILKKPCRNWADGLAVGSRDSLRKYAERLWGPERAKIKRFGKIYKDESLELYSMRQLTV